MEETMANKVAESGIITLDLEDYYPKEIDFLFELKHQFVHRDKFFSIQKIGELQELHHQ